MTEVEQVQVQSASHLRNMARVKRDEEELRRLMEGRTSETQEQEPDSESIEAAPVQAEDSAEQEEKDFFKAEAQEAAPLNKEEESFKKRYGDLRRHMQEKEQEWKIRFEQLEGQLSKAAKNELVLPKSEKDIEAWTKKYPDVAAIVEAIADKKAQERSSDIDNRLKEIEALRVQARKDKAEAELMALHPDFKSIRSDDAFHDWAEDQPKWVQDALYDNLDDAKAVSRVIDLYKADKGFSTKKADEYDKDVASSVRTKRNTQPNHDETTGYFRESQVAKMSIKEYEKRMDEIMDAQRKGKFIYDMSKK